MKKGNVQGNKERKLDNKDIKNLEKWVLSLAYSEDIRCGFIVASGILVQFSKLNSYLYIFYFLILLNTSVFTNVLLSCLFHLYLMVVVRVSGPLLIVAK